MGKNEQIHLYQGETNTPINSPKTKEGLKAAITPALSHSYTSISMGLQKCANLSSFISTFLYDDNNVKVSTTSQKLKQKVTSIKYCIYIVQWIGITFIDPYNLLHGVQLPILGREKDHLTQKVSAGRTVLSVPQGDIRLQETAVTNSSLGI